MKTAFSLFEKMKDYANAMTLERHVSCALPGLCILTRFMLTYPTLLSLMIS